MTIGKERNSFNWYDNIVWPPILYNTLDSYQCLEV